MKAKPIPTTKVQVKPRARARARAGQSTIRVSAPRMVRTWSMFTVDGRQVYSYGHTGFTLDRGTGWHVRQKSTKYEDSNEAYSAKRLARAAEKLGVACEWREIEPTEMMGVYF